MGEYIVKETSDINTCKTIREMVFSEYAVPAEDDADIYDNIAIHFLCLKDNVAIGSGRMIISGDIAIFSRLAVLKEHREMGIGELINHARESMCYRKDIYKIYLNSTTPKFHEKLGYMKTGKIYNDAGIKVQEMMKELI